MQKTKDLDITAFLTETKCMDNFLRPTSASCAQQFKQDGLVFPVCHIVFTSGATGQPKGCTSSLSSLRHYLLQKIRRHHIAPPSVVYLASSLSFDPCFTDILSTFYALATLAIAPQYYTVSCGLLGNELKELNATLILCTPSLWNLGSQTCAYYLQ